MKEQGRSGKETDLRTKMIGIFNFLWNPQMLTSKNRNNYTYVTKLS